MSKQKNSRTMIVRRLAPLLVILSTAINVAAQDVEDNNVQSAILQGDYAAALRSLDTMDINKSASYNFYKGVAYESMGRFDSAAAAYTRSLQLNPAQAAAIKGLARSYSTTNSVKPAMASYKRVLEMDSTCVATRLQYATLLRKERKLGEAMEQYAWLIKHDSTNYYFWELAGDCSHQSGLSQFATHYLFHAYRLNPTNLALVNKYGLMLRMLNTPPRLIRPIIEEALTIDSTYFPLLELLGKMYIDEKNYPKAEEIYAKAYRMGDTTSRVVYKYLGISMFNNSRSLPATLRQLERAYRMDSTDVFCNYYYAQTLLRCNEFKSAIAVIDHTKNILYPDPTTATSFCELRGDINAQIFNYSQALSDYNEALTHSPNKASLMYKLGWYNRNNQDPDKALTYIAKYMELVDTDTAIAQSKRQEKMEQAQRLLEDIEQMKRHKDSIDLQNSRVIDSTVLSN